MIKRKLFTINLLGILFVLSGFIDKALAATIRIPVRQASPGSIIVVPIFADTATGIAGAQIVLTYDPGILIPKKIQTAALTASFTLVDSIASDRVFISLASATGITVGNGSLVEITFQVSSAASSNATSNLILQKVDLFDEATNRIPVTLVNGVFTVQPSGTISVLPNPFTPNGDGANDYVEFIIPDVQTKQVEIDIFNISRRRINEITKLSGNGYKWDGFDNDGKVLEPGIYIYLIRVDGKNIYNGTITLMR